MAAARMGLKTALYTLNLDLIAQMSCNPAVGGIAKGHLVREVDAFGGIMGEVTDAVGIQFRLLNTSRGPAVWSPRAQCDKQAYRLKMREVLESQPNLKIKQAEVADLIVASPESRVQSATNAPGGRWSTGATASRSSATTSSRWKSRSPQPSRDGVASDSMRSCSSEHDAAGSISRNQPERTGHGQPGRTRRNRPREPGKA